MNQAKNNQYIFDILRGYCQNEKFHSQGAGEGISMGELLNMIGFEKSEDFLLWYKSLTKEEIEAGKKNWCSGN
jgi:hypothetical protein